MKIIRLQAENVKKLRVVDISPSSGPLIEITGPNSSGKSSVLDAIYFALAGTKDLPSQPIRKGEHKASIRLELGEINVIRRFTESGTSLIVEAANGARFPSPQSMLDQLLGKLAFDPLAFTRMEPRQQLEELRKLVKFEENIDTIDGTVKERHNLRTLNNRDLKKAEGALASLALVPNETPDEEINTNDLLDRIKAAEQQNKRRDIQDNEISGLIIRAGNARAEAEGKRKTAGDLAQKIADETEAFRKRMAELNNLRAEIFEAADQRVKDAVAFEENAAQLTNALIERVETDWLYTRLRESTDLNSQIRLKKQRKTLEQKITAIQDVIDTDTKFIESETTRKQQIIASAVMPVPGLSFGNGEILFNDIPLAQSGGAEQLRISVAIAMAANPQLRIIRIKDGSLLDEQGLEVLRQMAADNDYQVWIERVDTSGKVGIVMEDGTAHPANA